MFSYQGILCLVSLEAVQLNGKNSRLSAEDLRSGPISAQD